MPASNSPARSSSALLSQSHPSPTDESVVYTFEPDPQGRAELLVLGNVRGMIGRFVVAELYDLDGYDLPAVRMATRLRLDAAEDALQVIRTVLAPTT